MRGATLPINRDWKDTWRLGVGAEWQATEKLILQAGFSYDSSPVKDANRLPDIPVGDAPPVGKIPLVLFSLAWVCWLVFLAMMI